MVYKIVLIRHGESEWNKENKFTGWYDCELSQTGLKEAKEAGEILTKEGYQFDVCYTSLLKRAIKTLWIVLETMNMMYLPVNKSWRLNERHYGALQGLNKAQTAEKHGEEQVKVWRRSYDIPPPALEVSDERYPGHERKYSSLTEQELPKTESLALTVDRVIPYWNDIIAPSVKEGKKVLVAAHGNSLRALVKYLDNIPNEEIVELNIPTGVPLVYELDENLKPIKHYYLGDQDAIQQKISSVASQAAKKKE